MEQLTPILQLANVHTKEDGAPQNAYHNARHFQFSSKNIFKKRVKRDDILETRTPATYGKKITQGP